MDQFIRIFRFHIRRLFFSLQRIVLMKSKRHSARGKRVVISIVIRAFYKRRRSFFCKLILTDVYNFLLFGCTERCKNARFHTCDMFILKLENITLFYRIESKRSTCVLNCLKNPADYCGIRVEQVEIKRNVGYSLPIFHSTIYSICRARNKKKVWHNGSTVAN